MVYLPTFSIIYHTNQTNVGKSYTPYMDAMGTSDVCNDL